MREGLLIAFLTLSLCVFGQQGTHTLTVIVENVNKEDGNIGVLVFNSSKGWPEDRFAALKDVVVPAHPGVVTVTIPGLPNGDYAVAIAHDVNRNHKLDKNIFGVPKEQWGMSNNPHATIKAPSFATAKFSLTGENGDPRQATVSTLELPVLAELPKIAENCSLPPKLPGSPTQTVWHSRFPIWILWQLSILAILEKSNAPHGFR